MLTVRSRNASFSRSRSIVRAAQRLRTLERFDQLRQCRLSDERSDRYEPALDTELVGGEPAVAGEHRVDHGPTPRGDPAATRPEHGQEAGRKRERPGDHQGDGDCRSVDGSSCAIRPVQVLGAQLHTAQVHAEVRQAPWRGETVQDEAQACRRWLPRQVQRSRDVEAVDHGVHEGADGAATGWGPGLHPRRAHRGEQLLRRAPGVPVRATVRERVPPETG